MTERLSFQHAVDVRFRDIDLGGHAHHSEALIYFEEARSAYWRQVVGRQGLQDIDYILAEMTVRYKQRVLYPDRLDVRVGVVRLGRKHFEMEYEVYSSDGSLLISGESTQVMYDYSAGVSKRVPEEVAERITAQDGPFDRRGARIS
mgnify:CR=1 FL=1